jgi:hypothetical protein
MRSLSSSTRNRLLSFDQHILSNQVDDEAGGGDFSSIAPAGVPPLQ